MAEFQQRYNGDNRVNMRLWMNIPKKPEKIAQAQIWNAMVKNSVRDALVFHHQNHIPRHFKRDARTRYNHKPRNEKYKAWKKRRFGSIIDLVMTGSTRDKMTKANGYDRIVIGGAALGGKKDLQGKLSYTFGFNNKIVAFYKAQKAAKTRDPRARRSGASAAKSRRGVTLRDMRAELQTITADEAESLRKVFETALWGRVDAYKAGRKTVGRK